MKLLLGKKQGMTNIFREDGRFVPVTIIKSGKNFITALRSEEKDGYSAIQVGFGDTRKAKKPQVGQFKKAKTPDLRHLREVRVSEEELSKHKEGEQFTVSVFSEGEKIKVTGISKGKGFQGVIKRHGFRRGPMGHGSDHHREPGSIGSAYPQHVMKGTKLPGQTGKNTISTRNLEIEGVDLENEIIYVKGAVPGPNKALIMLIGVGEFESTMVEAPKNEKKKEKSVEDKAAKSDKPKEKVEDKVEKNEDDTKKSENTVNKEEKTEKSVKKEEKDV